MSDIERISVTGEAGNITVGDILDFAENKVGQRPKIIFYTDPRRKYPFFSFNPNQSTQYEIYYPSELDECVPYYVAHEVLHIVRWDESPDSNRLVPNTDSKEFMQKSDKFRTTLNKLNHRKKMYLLGY